MKYTEGTPLDFNICNDCHELTSEDPPTKYYCNTCGRDIPVGLYPAALLKSGPLVFACINCLPTTERFNYRICLRNREREGWSHEGADSCGQCSVRVAYFGRRMQASPSTLSTLFRLYYCVICAEPMASPTSSSPPSTGRICHNCDSFREETRRRTKQSKRLCSSCRWEVDESKIPFSSEYSDLCRGCRALMDVGPEGV